MKKTEQVNLNYSNVQSQPKRTTSNFTEYKLEKYYDKPHMDYDIIRSF